MENTHKLLLIYLNVMYSLEYLKHCHIISLNASLKTVFVIVVFLLSIFLLFSQSRIIKQ